MDTSNSLFVKCNCGCNILEISFDDFCGDGSEQFDFAVWSTHAGHLPLSIKERIRWCWNALKTGNPWGDHVIISIEDANTIVDFLKKHTTKKIEIQKINI